MNIVGFEYQFEQMESRVNKLESDILKVNFEKNIRDIRNIYIIF